MNKTISLILSIVLILIMSMIPVVANTGVSSQTSVYGTTESDTTGGTSDTEAESDTTESTSNTEADSVNNTSTTAADTIVVDSDGQTVTAGTLEDSSFSWFTEFVDKLQLVLTFDPVKKAHLIERQLLKELAYAQELAKKGKLPEAQHALDKYNEKITAAQDFLDKIEDPDSDEAQILIKALDDTQAENIVVLTDLLDKIPPQAAQKIAFNIVRGMEKFVEKETSTSDQKSDNSDQDQNQNKDKKKNKKEVKEILENYQKNWLQLCSYNNQELKVSQYQKINQYLKVNQDLKVTQCLKAKEDQKVKEDLQVKDLKVTQYPKAKEDQKNLTGLKNLTAPKNQGEKTLPVDFTKSLKTEKQWGYEQDNTKQDNTKLKKGYGNKSVRNINWK